VPLKSRKLEVKVGGSSAQIGTSPQPTTAFATMSINISIQTLLLLLLQLLDGDPPPPLL